jgi:hypothetical protein
MNRSPVIEGCVVLLAAVALIFLVGLGLVVFVTGNPLLVIPGGN